VLSSNGARRAGDLFARQAEDLGWPVIENARAGPALRQIALTRPAGVVVLVDGPHSLQICASLISDLRRYQPRLPLVAVADGPSEQAEQTLRTAGATAYLARASANAVDAAELIAAARPRREPPELVPRVAPARSPPPARGQRAPPRIRGQP
jgi:hypothetical protein